ncbi:MAG TPA: glucose-1-phosphate adenylyltransferase [Elusimicrobia bacterium]|nr:glucose-1-phosphate adenylyltransferase [Elusimicrobiota bacterium]
MIIPGKGDRRKRVLAFILAGGKGQRLEPLTVYYPKPAVAFGGVYKIIDFTLSNCLNSDIRNIYALVQYKSAELIRHLRDGWQMYFSTARGEYLEIIPPQYAGTDQSYVGTADAIYQNLYLIEQEQPDYVVILAGDHIYKMDYRRMIETHRQNEADLTVGSVEMPLRESIHFGVIQADAENRIVGFQEKPKDATPIPGNPEHFFASMGIYVFKPQVLIDFLMRDAADSSSHHDFGKDIITKMVASHRVFTYSFIDENRKTAKYWRDVGTLDAYYYANMDLIGVDPVLNLYDASWPILSAPVQAPPPKTVFRENGRTGIAVDSMLSPGCIVSGGRVIHSILSPYVNVHSWAHVEDSILFERVDVARHARIRRAIVTEGVRIPEGAEIGYNPDRDRDRFILTEQGVVIVQKGAKI